MREARVPDIHPQNIRPFVRHDPGSGATEFMIPQIKPGSLETVHIPKGSKNYGTYFHPVRIPARPPGGAAARFHRWGTAD